MDWIGLDWIALDWIKNNKSGHNTNLNKSTMNCLTLLAHCHRTGTRVRILEQSGSNANQHQHHRHDQVRTRVANANANVMEASLYDRSPVRTVITPEAMQHLLQTAAFVHADAADDRVCPITQAEFAEGDAALTLPCGHVFIRDAIQTWLETESAECPVCRHALPSREVITAALDAE